MSVYVDPMAPCIQNAVWGYPVSCHLFADSVPELHDLAGKLKLRRAWFQRSSGIPHYDLTASKRRHAVRIGAVAMTRAEAVAKWQEIRKLQRAMRADSVAAVNTTPQDAP